METSLSSLVSVLKRRFWPALATFASVIGASIAYLVYTSPVYEVKARLMLDNKQVSVSPLGRDLSQLPNRGPGGANPIANQAELVKSQRILQQAIDQVFSQYVSNLVTKITPKELKKDLTVKNIPATNILEISYQNQNPELATVLLNAVANAMVYESTEAIRQEARAVREFLEKELPQQRALTEAAEVAESKYRKSSGLVSFNEQTESLVESLAKVEDQERLLYAQLEEINARLKAIEQLTGFNTINNAYVGGRVGQDEQLDKLRDKLADLDSELATVRSRFNENHPTVLSLLEERDAIRSLYNDKIATIAPNPQTISPSDVASDQLSQELTSRYIISNTEQLALAEKLKVLQRERAILQNHLEQLPIKQQRLTALVRQREEATESLKFLQNKLEEARIAEAQLVSNIRIIAEAQVPSLPSEPNKKVVLVLATAAGITLAIGIILLLEVIDNKLYDVSDAEVLLKLPRLGVLPEIPLSALSLKHPEQFLDDLSLVEPYRLLLKKLEFRTQQKLKLIVVSSTVSGEGKSIVASHLAAVSAMLSRQTLIIDADLRKPKQHRILGVTPLPGLTDVIDRDINLFETVQPTSIENLSILTSGGLFTNPSRVLESASMKHLLAKAATHYDLVIIDTPPISSCADVHTLSRYSEGLVMITRPNFTPKDILLQAGEELKELKDNGLPILGVVINGMTAQTERFYSYSDQSYQSLSKSLKRLSDLNGSLNKSVAPGKSVLSRGSDDVEQ
ncbi:MAG: polysaccharide biosynthesis tyrosine autokinase [Moorea sp. SIO1F2]|uniref:GumC family protein n=1 Tax=unclassified Moorena TaxID=2683338 RepID=UPI0013B66809|nr:MULTISPECIES: polysaccharide biosynthesis tyrosine autokinase [unclassified Moorena]NEO20071.1 polysaccharide biosynthesis tyrosine autokinase [Moorena sp. SIO4A5]NEP24456.1 polysaccharide biosynthesis tyrosine autokinase [Moorena sp. SIO3I6]NEQ60821.1 polysaccharide biosynthesis tyrosine autokinase [Moorena sp. SIO4A1]NET83838.1 polysaccharide biosynthesis tyrosine autokinase [Moorena sp. SIO1F2]